MEFLAPDLIGPGSRGTAGNGERITLAASRCERCGRVDFPPMATCSACGSQAAPVELSGPGRLGAHTSVLHPPPGGLVPVPYDIGVAEFPEGISILGLLIDGEDAPRGADLEIVSVEVDGRLTYGFRLLDRPADAADGRE